jgi:hypothetical protein
MAMNRVQTDGQTDGQMDGRIDGQTDRQQKTRESVFFFNLKNHLKFSTFSMTFTFYLRHLDPFLSI